MANTTHHNLPLIGGPATQNMWAIVDGAMVLIERGRTAKARAGEAIAVRDLVFFGEDTATPTVPKVQLATNADRPMLGFATMAAAYDAELFVQTDGVVIDPQATPTWNWTPGALLYAHGSTPGALTETQPSGFAPPVAVALSATTIWVLPAGMRDSEADTAPATQLLEGSATPATLDLGAIADGQFLRRSGTDVVGHTLERSLVLAVAGDPAASATVSIRLVAPTAGTITAIKSTTRTTPASTYTYDINKNGTTIYSTQGNRPTRTNGNGTSTVTHTQPDVLTFAKGDVFTIDLDTAGTGIDSVVFHIEYVEP